MQRKRSQHIGGIITAALIALAIPSSAQAYSLGAADGSIEAAPIANQLGARTYRIVMDPSVPLERYAPRIDAYRAAGLRPQLVIGGTGTDVRGKTAEQGYWFINYALKAFKRWPDTYSISVHNEPELSGAGVCRYAQNFRRAYKALKKAGVPRVLFGEFSPAYPLQWTEAIVERCGKITADGFAWHCYDQHKNWVGIDNARLIKRKLTEFRKQIHSPRGYSLALYCTEYGALTRTTSSCDCNVSDQDGARRWSRALKIAREQKLVQIVAWGISETHENSKWDSSIQRTDGSFRPAFKVIAER
jgi:hypothetical protein